MHLSRLAHELQGLGRDHHEPAILKPAAANNGLWLLIFESNSDEHPTLCFIGSRENAQSVTALVDDYTFDIVPPDDAVEFGSAVLLGAYRVERRRILGLTVGRQRLVVDTSGGLCEATPGLGDGLSHWERDAASRRESR